MGLVVVYLLANIAVGAIACFFGKRLFYVVLGLLVAASGILIYKKQ